ncbi:DUF2092 domain-containing protein [Stenotrophomonas terrae]|uniref:DUF2092 domain-containing protein n=1 Tax=Stenotrophomonas terrae TaxID=405446 RepID=UPI00320B5A30
MNTIKRYGFVAGSALLLAALPLTSQAAKQAASAAAAAPAAVDAGAVAALERMGAALRALKQFTLVSDATTEVVLDSGQKIELDSRVNYQVQPPRHLFVDMDSARTHRQLFYDGKTMTLYSPRLKYYASVDDVDATLSELAGKLWTEYGIDLPLADLFQWGSATPPHNVLTSAVHVGTASVDGAAVDQYAFRQPDVDWQLWIGQDDHLPRRIVIISQDDAALPAYTARLKWDVRAPINQASFTFTPPQGAARIGILVVDAVAMQPGEK